MKKLTNIIAVTSLLLSMHTFVFAAQERPAPKADVYVIPQPKDLSLSLSYPAQIYSSKSVNVVARVSGVLQEKFFKEGSFVKKGDILYKIEDDMYKVKVDAAKASVNMSQANFDNASRKWKRVQKLYKNKVVSQENRDNALFAYDEAIAGLSLAKANLHQANIDLDYTNVKAPISGIVGLHSLVCFSFCCYCV